MGIEGFGGSLTSAATFLAYMPAEGVASVRNFIYFALPPLSSSGRDQWEIRVSARLPLSAGAFGMHASGSYLF